VTIYAAKDAVRGLLKILLANEKTHSLSVQGRGERLIGVASKTVGVL
jgi:hypothetical protein